MKPRVLNIVADGKPGGGTTVVLGLCSDTLNSGEWDVGLVTDAGSYAASKGRETGVQVFELPFFGSGYLTGGVTGLRKIIREFKPDLIHVHGCRSALPIALLKRFGISVPVVYTVHGFHFVKKKPLTKLLGKWSELLVARTVDRVVFVSEGDRAIAVDHRLVSRTKSRTYTIYNGVDTRALDELSQGAEKTFDLVFAARLVYQKNPTFAIDVLGKLRDADVRLLLVGGGELEADCRRLAEEHGVGRQITFAGQLDHAATIKAIASAQLCLLPSRWEGLPVTLIEASYLGVPVVGSDIPGNDEVVLKDRTGILIPEFNAKQYADAILKLLGDRSLLQRFAEFGRERASQLFTRTRCSAQYFNVYRDVEVLARGG